MMSIINGFGREIFFKLYEAEHDIFMPKSKYLVLRREDVGVLILGSNFSSFILVYRMTFLMLFTNLSVAFCQIIHSYEIEF